jgi:protein gp37
MAEDSRIEWTRHTANLWWGCQEVHEGCDHCYARTLARAKGKAAAWDGSRFAVGSIWDNLRKWQDAAAKAGEVHRVFCGSMMDIFEKPLPASDWHGNPLGISTGEIRDRYFREVIPATPNLLHLMLTKRPGNVTKYVPLEWLKAWPRNVMTGASVVNQATADTLIDQLLRVPGPRFLSVEPLLGAINLGLAGIASREIRQFWTPVSALICWVIVGGESGPGARPMHRDWARAIRDECRDNRVPFFFKQWGEWLPCDEEMDRSEVGEGADYNRPRRALFPDGSHLPDLTGRGSNGDGSVVISRVGKKAAGRTLDGRIWDGPPDVPILSDPILLQPA